MKSLSAKRLCRTAVLSALYASVTLLFAPLAFGPIQLRPAEALTALPMLFWDAVPALAIGCLVANLLSPYGVIDLLVGTCATLLSAILTRVCKKKPWLAMAFPVVINFAFLTAMWLAIGGVGNVLLQSLSLLATQTAFCYGLGLPLYYALKKRQPYVPFLQDKEAV